MIIGGDASPQASVEWDGAALARRKSGTFSASLRYQLMRAVPGVFPCGVNLRLISRAATLTARVPSRPNIQLAHYLTKRYRAGFGDAPLPEPGKGVRH